MEISQMVAADQNMMTQSDLIDNGYTIQVKFTAKLSMLFHFMIGLIRYNL